VRDGEPLILWDWTFSHIPDIWRRVLEHMELTGIAVGLGFVLAFGLSLVIRRIPALYAPVTWVAGVLYAIPSLALFALLIPFTGLSIVTAEIGLVSYTLLILVRNIVGGLRSVPPDVREAAVYYFAHSYSPDPAVMPLVVRAIERYGFYHAFEMYTFMDDLVQTEVTVRWLIAQIERAGPPANEQEAQPILVYSSALVHADAAVLQGHEHEIMGIRRRDKLLKRFEALEESRGTCLGAPCIGKIGESVKRWRSRRRPPPPGWRWCAGRSSARSPTPDRQTRGSGWWHLPNGRPGTGRRPFR